MKVDDKLVERLAHLSRLEFADEAKTKMKSDFEKILHFVEKLEEVDTDGVEPLVYMSSETNVLRVCMTIIIRALVDNGEDVRIMN